MASLLIDSYAGVVGDFVCKRNFLHKETILIAWNSMKLDKAIKSDASLEEIVIVENELEKLGKERQGCYDVNSNAQIITKVFAEFRPKLKAIGLANHD